MIFKKTKEAAVAALVTTANLAVLGLGALIEATKPFYSQQESLGFFAIALSLLPVVSMAETAFFYIVCMAEGKLHRPERFWGFWRND